MSDGLRVVTEMLSLWKRMDVDGALACFAEDAVFVDAPGARPARGKAAIRAVFDGYLRRMKTYDFEVRTSLGSERLVYLERFDVFGLADGSTMRIPLLGVFEIDESAKIAAWRDYWDTAMVRSRS
jgi:limonene-1,2-epoxide hydrolase